MKVIKEGQHRLFEEDAKTTQYVQEMLRELKKNGMDAVRSYSEKFDDWNPSSFELNENEINIGTEQATGGLTDKGYRRSFLE